MNNMKQFLLIVLLAITSVSFAQEEVPKKKKEHPIDQRMKECIEKDYSDSAMTQCVWNALEEWDAELNKNYKKLMSLLPEDGKQALRKAQREWIKYRDAEIKATIAIFGQLQGTMYDVLSADNIMRITKDRALKLENYIHLLEM